MLGIEGDEDLECGNLMFSQEWECRNREETHTCHCKKMGAGAV